METQSFAEETVSGRLQIQVFTDTGTIHWNTIYSNVGMTRATSLQDLKREMEWVLNNSRQYICHPNELRYVRILINGKVVEKAEFPEEVRKFEPTFEAPVYDPEFLYMNDFEDRFMSSMER